MLSIFKLFRHPVLMLTCLETKKKKNEFLSNLLFTYTFPLNSKKLAIDSSSVHTVVEGV